GGTHLIFHKNTQGNLFRQVFSQDPADLSDARPTPRPFGQGHYWGRPCPAAPFVAGTDFNAANVVDTHPFGQASVRTGGTRGSAPVLAAPALIFPAEGAFVSTATPTFTGTADSGVAVELLEGVARLGAAVANAC